MSLRRVYCLVSCLMLFNITIWSQNYKIISDISYRLEGDEYALSRCKLDLYVPVGVKDFPTVVWFHGGGLTGGEHFIPDELKECGLGIVSVNYRLLPKSELEDCIDDAAASVAWTFKNIEKYGGSIKKIFVAGHSAGGYLTNMIGLDKKWLKKYDIDADSIAALAPFSGHAISHFIVSQRECEQTNQV